MKVSKNKFYHDFYYNFKRPGYDLQTFMTLFQITKTFQFHGFSLCINNACASGLYALESGAEIIKSGKCSKVIVAAVDHPDIFKHLWFKELNMLSGDGKIRPFDNNADGFALGEGGAAIIIEDLTSAMKRKSKIYAEYCGGGFNLENWKISFPAIKENYYHDCIKSALVNSGTDPDEVDLINLHGVANKITDIHESRAIEKVFKGCLSRKIITALKPYTGHTLGGCALLESVILFLCMEKGIALPTLNLNNKNPKVNVDLITSKVRSNIQVAVKTSCGFAGNNAAVVFKKYR